MHSALTGGKMKNNSTKKLVLSAIMIAVNIVLGTTVDMLKIPLLFLDTLGTILGSVILGPFYGMAIGGLTNVIQGIITNPKTIPFAIVNIVVGLVVGLIAKNRKFSVPVAVITGVILSIVAPLIGTPIALAVFGGLTGDFNDVFFTIMKGWGAGVFSSAFIPRVASNLVDKIVSCLLASFLSEKVKTTMKI